MRFNEKGFNDLMEGKRSGRPSELTPQQIDTISADLKAHSQYFFPFT
ncbi:MAG: hypothetical protein ACYCPR_04160 [Thermoplasmataceae archaeon]